VLEPALSRWAGQHAAGTPGKPASNRLGKAESQALREGIAAFEAKRWDLADAAFRKAADEDEYDYRPVLYQLRILIEQGRAAEAVGPLRDLATENPQENEVLLYLGIALEKAAAYDDARLAFQRILQDEPQQPVALLHLGTTANAQRAWNDAAEPLRTLVGIQPRNQEAWLQLGFAQANLEQWTGADESFRQVLAINPNSQVAREWRAKIRPRLSH
jgi:tetratricopeptide (TPR) repeat protein